MSYSEKDGQVTLTMSRDDYERLSQIFALASVPRVFQRTTVELWNRLNQGNPNYTPYQVSDS